MEENEAVDPHYKQGFNEGYFIAEHWPDMSDSFAHVPNKSPRLDGFRDGHRQFVLDLAKANRPKFLQKDIKDVANDKHKSPDRDLDR